MTNQTVYYYFVGEDGPVLISSLDGVSTARFDLSQVKYGVNYWTDEGRSELPEVLEFISDPQEYSHFAGPFNFDELLTFLAATCPKLLKEIIKLEV